MSATDIKKIEELEQRVKEDIPIPKRWKKYIIDEFKRQAGSVEEIYEIGTIVFAWRWTMKDRPMLWEVIRYLDVYPAATAYTLTLHYIADHEDEDDGYSDKNVKKISSRIRRELYRLHLSGLLDNHVLDPSLIDPGRHCPTIFYTPWAKQQDIDKVEEFYIKLGGKRGTKDKKTSKSPEDISEFNRKVKVIAALDRLRTGYKFYDFYQCPKNHPEGLIRERKTKKGTLDSLKVYKCSNCDKNLDKIPYETFIKKKEKELYEYFGLK